VKHALLVGLLIVAVPAGFAMAVETPPYKTVVRDGNYELRDYPTLVVAEVRVEGEQKAAANEGFRLLASYIFGANRKRQDIAMTAPVAQQEVGEKIAMTAPVAQVPGADGTWVVRFTMPSQWSLQTLPVPDNPAVTLRDTEPGRFAVLRFSGLARPEDVRKRSAELLAWAEARGLRVTGPVSLAQYNPPWTLWFLRRNEVMVEVAF
jgi:DNA gyrase inhibitor GyrI